MATKFLPKIIHFLNVGLDEYLIQSFLLVAMRIFILFLLIISLKNFLSDSLVASILFFVLKSIYGLTQGDCLNSNILYTFVSIHPLSRYILKFYSAQHNFL